MSLSRASLLACLALTSCAKTDAFPPICDPGSYRCTGSLSMRCSADGTGWVVDADCATRGLACTTQGCLACEPKSQACKGQDLLACNEQGTGFLAKPLLSCDGKKGMICNSGGCSNACELARSNRSYMGCEYWAVDLDNAVVDIGSAASQQYALALSNPSSLSAQITVSQNDAAHGEPVQLKEVTRREVAPGALEVILLPPREVDGSRPGEFNTGGGTALTSNAYRIESTAPIIIYQFNPLENVSVFSNDASLLVPAPALTTDATTSHGASYLVMGWPQTIGTSDDPKKNFGTDLRAFLTIVGTREKTSVRVTLAADTVPDLAGKVPARKKGETLDVVLNPFDVLNLETGAFAADFTGSRIDADKPVVVFSGSEASDVPDFPDLTTRRCCADHLEEQLFPITTLGRAFVVLVDASRSQALKDAGASITAHTEPEYFRVLTPGEFAVVQTNLPTPDDELSVGASYTQLKAEQDFVIQSSEPLVVGAFMVSQEEAGIPSSLPGGDPSFIVLPPVEQYRKDYLFLTPDKYAFDFIGVAVPHGTKVKLDGRTLQQGTVPGPGAKLTCTLGAVGRLRRPGEKADTDYDAYKCQLSFPKIVPEKTPPANLLPGEQNDGVHRLTADQPVGLVVYGFDAYVSYGYPGGTDLALINLK